MAAKATCDYFQIYGTTNHKNLPLGMNITSKKLQLNVSVFMAGEIFEKHGSFFPLRACLRSPLTPPITSPPIRTGTRLAALDVRGPGSQGWRSILCGQMGVKCTERMTSSNGARGMYYCDECNIDELEFRLGKQCFSKG